MNYTQAIAFLDRCINYERLGFEHMTLDRHLDEFAAFLDRLGAPQNSCPIIHIAGTKGKGSTALFLAAALERNGYKTGLYTSPHIENYTERIRVGLREISRDDFGRLLDIVVSHYPPEKQHDHAGFRTVFEILTAMAMWHFRECGVDAVLLETGLGGRLDATNVVDPLISVITTLGLEHTEILGEAIEQIAAEKAGIIKPGCPVVVSRQQARWRDRVWPVIERHARDRLSPLHKAEEMIPLLDRTPGPRPDSPQRVEFAGFARNAPSLTFTVPLPGEHQAANLQTALAALSLMRNLGWNIEEEKVRAGIEAARFAGRVEVLATHQPLVLDCAHCPSSFRALLSTLDELFPRSPIILLMGLARRKRRVEIFELLAGSTRIDRVMFYPLPSPRSDAPGDLAAAARQCGLNASAFNSVRECLDAAMQAQTQISDAVIVGAGSFYGMAPLRHEWENRKDLKPG